MGSITVKVITNNTEIVVKLSQDIVNNMVFIKIVKIA